MNDHISQKRHQSIITKLQLITICLSITLTAYVYFQYSSSAACYNCGTVDTVHEFTNSTSLKWKFKLASASIPSLHALLHSTNTGHCVQMVLVWLATATCITVHDVHCSHILMLRKRVACRWIKQLLVLPIHYLV